MKIIAFLSTVFLCVNALYGDNYPSSNDQRNGKKYNQSESIVRTANDPQLGKILTDAQGRTLYMYTDDNDNVSNCYGKCAMDWPPLMISSGQQPKASSDIRGNLGTTQRKDNQLQVTYNGMPLYYYVKDSRPGDVKGQNVDNKWYVINPDSGPNMSSKQSNGGY